MIGRDIEEAMDCSVSKMNVSILANAAGVSKKKVERIIKNKCESDFCDYLDISKFLFETEDTLIKWMYSFERPSNLCASMEYLALKKNIKELKKFIDQKVLCEETKNKPALRRWGNLYKLIADYEENPIDHESMLDKITKKIPADTEMHLLIKLVEASVCYRILSDKEAYLKKMKNICVLIKNDVDEMDESFFKRSFQYRLNDLLGKSELFVNVNIEEARKYAQKNINQNICATLKANSYYLLGRSFTFESCEERIKYTKLAIKFYRLAGDHGFADSLERQSIPFIKAHYNISVPKEDKEGRAYYEAKWGDKEKAKSLLKEIIAEHGENMYRIFYLGLANNDPIMLTKSLAQFLKVGDNFFAQLPLEHLREFTEPHVAMLTETIYNQLAI
ncbi:AimR family lysis-lysogeny pheromone receptor [Priestia megaterium]|uniref:AimR family lysis-lysogeny pheromone receptor n=1 Tax=Priestia megaterium TaxID=1404 RepID=UPI0034599B0D